MNIVTTMMATSLDWTNRGISAKTTQKFGKLFGRPDGGIAKIPTADLVDRSIRSRRTF
jgi:hypothetical protein